VGYLVREFEYREESGRRPWLIIAAIAVAVLLLGAKSIAGIVIEYQWWKEMRQVPTWLDMLLYSFGPRLAGAAIAFAVLMVTQARAMRFAGERLKRHKTYARISAAVIALISLMIAGATIAPWPVARYLGSRGMAGAAGGWTDPVFGKPLGFYLFDLPFWTVLLNYVLALTLVAIAGYIIVARAWQLRYQFPSFSDASTLDLRDLRLQGGLESKFLRVVTAVVLLALAANFFLGRYALLLNDHGFMVGMDYVDEHYRLPLQWAAIISCVLAAAVFSATRRWRWLLLVPAVLVLRSLVPAIMGSVYVKPNEISLERPYIERHIQATRSAFGLDKKLQEVDYHAKLETRFDPAEHSAVLGNARLWDWQAFHDTITQIQALRPYYKFSDTDVDRYVINGQLRQVMVSPRELDMTQLPASAQNWINPRFIYTHGYGVVMAEANRITENGLPVPIIQDAPPQVLTPNLKLTRPEIYYGEVVHEPVFVNTAEREFNYPAGSGNVLAKYAGNGGFPVSSFWMRLAAALSESDPNVLFTGYLTPNSRMMIRRDVGRRLEALAGFLTWDDDPYLVLTDSGRLVWTVDGYTTSAAHPYSRHYNVTGAGRVNYMRNAVKATIDAYDGSTQIFIFDDTDPVIRSYQALFPDLFQPFSKMSPELREHARYPERFFRVQAEVYRTYHMQDPQAFYNNEDLWDVPRMARAQADRPDAMRPTYIVAALPGEKDPEFLLTIPFTPRNKDNMIGLMVARCDGDKLGELVVFQLSKQALIYGPMQVEARINQDQIISKDLSLWNQQGSQVLRGQLLVLPLADTFIYIQPIYIQARDARMPQLKKVALVMGDQLFYTDNYDQAVAALSAYMKMAPVSMQAPAAAEPAQAQPAAAPAQPSPELQRRLDSIREHLRQYRTFASQGRWAEAGRELEAIEREAGQR
jgi:uncharacterized membrane protein (UPF0182 family)